MLRNDSSHFTLKDDDGNPVRQEVGADQANILSLKDLLESYNKQATAISSDMTSTPAEKAEQISVLKQDPLYSSRLFGEAVRPTHKAAPLPGFVSDGFRFKGGDPSKESNWEQIR